MSEEPPPGTPARSASDGAFLVCTAIWFASGAHGQFWPVWILIIVLLTVGRSAWALFGPSPDLDAAEQALDARRQRRLESHQRHDHHRRDEHHRRD